MFGRVMLKRHHIEKCEVVFLILDKFVLLRRCLRRDDVSDNVFESS